MCRRRERAPKKLPTLDLLTKGWSGFVAGHGLTVLEGALPAWLPRQRWFGAKTRKISDSSRRGLGGAAGPGRGQYLDSVYFGHSCRPRGLFLPALFYIEIGYGDNQCDVYQIPLGLQRRGRCG